MTKSILDTIVAHKQEELARDRAAVPLSELRAAVRDVPPTRSFTDALKSRGTIRLIAEVKKASPSKGVIREDFHPVKIAREYASAGADALSVLTDERFFQGSLDFLREIRAAVELPILRKDFTLDPYHVWQARVAGADAILLIVAILSDAELCELFDCAASLGLATLVEVHNGEELERALAVGANIVGVNNRDLRTFETTLEATFRLRPQIPPECVVVSESGIHTRADVRRLEAARVDAMLVGESLMRSENISAKIAELRTDAAF